MRGLSCTVVVLSLAALLIGGLAENAAAACVKGVSKRDTLRMRAGPSARAAELAGIPPDSCRFRVTGPCQSGWCPVAYDGMQGWARQQYIWMDTRPDPDGQARAREPDARAEREQMALMRPGSRLPVEADEPPPPPNRDLAPPPPVAAPAPLIRPEPKPAPARPPAAEVPPPPRAPDPQRADDPPPVETRRAAALPPAPPVAKAPAQAASDTKCAKGPGNGQRMRIRAAPGASSDALYGIQPGTCGIEITGTCRANWCPVAIGSYRGWADRRELE